MEETSFPLIKRLGLILGFVLFLVLLFLPRPEGMSVEGQRVAAITVLMAIWWITECLPIPATSLIPLVLFPLFGVMPMKTVASCFGDANILLFAGGFFIAMAMQKWGLHKRIALLIVYFVGTNPSRLVLGFMLATAFLSMWISNTATCLMLLPIGVSTVMQLEGLEGEQSKSHFATALMLGIAYAASIGGIGTLIGTPPNIVLAAQMRQLFPGAPEIGFFQWMLVGIPLVVIFLPISWWLLTRIMFPAPHHALMDTRKTIHDELLKLGRTSRGEWIVLVVFILTALGWIFRKDLALGFVTVPGWSRLLPQPGYLHDGVVAIFFALILFMIPVDLKRSRFALDWETALKIPWGILLLFGGGLAIASGVKETGLIHWLGAQLSLFEGLPPFVIILGIAVLMTFLTEITSNTATTTVMLPILAATAAHVIQVHPLLLMLPAAMSASCAFMLPVATPPNAIVFGSGYISIRHMARAGLVLNLIGVLLVTLITYVLAVPVFGIDLHQAPAWLGH